VCVGAWGRRLTAGVRLRAAAVGGRRGLRKRRGVPCLVSGASPLVAGACGGRVGPARAAVLAVSSWCMGVRPGRPGGVRSFRAHPTRVPPVVWPRVRARERIGRALPGGSGHGPVPGRGAWGAGVSACPHAGAGAPPGPEAAVPSRRGVHGGSPGARQAVAVSRSPHPGDGGSRPARRRRAARLRWPAPVVAARRPSPPIPCRARPWRGGGRRVGAWRARRQCAGAGACTRRRCPECAPWVRRPGRRAWGS